MAKFFVYGDEVLVLNDGPGTEYARDGDIVSPTGLGGPSDLPYLFGDVRQMNYFNTGTSYGGDDWVEADDRAASLFGDAEYMNFYTSAVVEDGEVVAAAAAMGGSDTLTGAGGNDTLYGDSYIMNYYSSYATAVGGDDVLNGGDGDDVFYGDAIWMNMGRIGATAEGGDDVLNGGAGNDTLYGDARFMNYMSSYAKAIGGDDVLNGGSGDDDLWGDAFSLSIGPPNEATGGHDTFVFDEGSGQDTIHDFRFGNDAEGRDLIDLSALDLGLPPIPFDRLPPKALAHVTEVFSGQAWDQLDDYITIDEKGRSAIDIGAATGGEAGIDIILVVGVDDLSVDDFVFF